jgi:putative ABC transport system permease protein
MLTIAWKMLSGDRAKYLGIVVSLGFTTLLITLQGAMMLSILSSTTSFIDAIGGVDMWVTDAKSQYIEDIKPMTDTQVYRVRSVPGVAWAVPLYKGSITARMPDGTTQHTQLIGLDDATLIGGPGEMISGALADLHVSDAVIVDADAARDRLSHRNADGTSRMLQIGDTLELNDHYARVMGIYRGIKNFQSEPVIYTTYNRAKAFVPSQRKLLSYILVKLQPDADVARVQRELMASIGLRGRTTAEFSEESLNWFIANTNVLMSFGMSTGIAFLIGGGIAGMTFYNFMLDNQRHFAVLRAMGAGTRTLVGMVVLQALGVTLIGFGIGIGAVALFTDLMSDGPVTLRLTWPLLGASAAIIVLVGGTSGSLGLRRVLRLDPAMVFN